jgi:hypothetical protein
MYRRSAGNLDLGMGRMVPPGTTGRSPGIGPHVGHSTTRVLILEVMGASPAFTSHNRAT